MIRIICNGEDRGRIRRRVKGMFKGGGGVRVVQG